VPGRWEGDLLIGKDCKSAVGTLVEQTTRSILLLHLPTQRLPGRHAMRQAITTRPAGLARTITWDRANELACRAGFTIVSGIPACFSHHTNPGSMARTRTSTGCCIRRFWWLFTPGPPGKEHSLGPGWGCCAPYRTHI
jgi:transposase, IS30 family